MCSAIVCGIVTGDALVSYWPIFYFLQLALDKRRSERLPTVHCDCVSDKMAEFPSHIVFLRCFCVTFLSG